MGAYSPSKSMRLSQRRSFDGRTSNKMAVRRESKYQRLPESGSTERASDTDLLKRWEEMGRRKFGISRIYSLILLIAACGLALMGAWFLLGWIFGSSGSAHPKVDIKAEDGDIRNKSTVTTISMGFGPDGKMTTETTTETTGTDKDGHIHATRETKSGEGANAEAEAMMSQVNQMMGGFGGLGGLLGGFFGPPKRKDPVEELIESLMGFPSANHAMQRKPRQRHSGPMIGMMEMLGLPEPVHTHMPGIQVINMDDLFGGAHRHHHQHQHMNTRPGKPAAVLTGKPLMLDVVKPVVEKPTVKPAAETKAPVPAETPKA